MNINLELKNKIITDESQRWCEIYKITNTANQSLYVGQSVSHILNHKKYRPYGMEGRFRCHISETFSSKKNQSQYLNNAIKKYGVKSFTLHLICNCSIEDADKIETEEILKNTSLFPNGYNLNTGGKTFRATDESKRRVSIGMISYSKDKKLERYKDIVFNVEESEFIKYLKPDKTGGWYVYINNIKGTFGGVIHSSEENKQRAINFLRELKEISRARLLDAGNPLEL